MHDFLTVGAAAPLQEAGVVGARRCRIRTTSELAAAYQRRRDVLLDILERHRFTCYKPRGAYYIMTDISAFGFADDVAFARYLVKDVGVAAVPGQQLLSGPGGGPHQAAILLLQEGRNARGSRSSAGEARPGRRALRKCNRKTRRREVDLVVVLFETSSLRGCV